MRLQSSISNQQSAMALDIAQSFNVARYFVDRNLEEGRGDKAAVHYGDEIFTYREIAEQVNRAANAFSRAGIARGDRVQPLVTCHLSLLSVFQIPVSNLGLLYSPHRSVGTQYLLGAI